jgi:hypothetical protein
MPINLPTGGPLFSCIVRERFRWLARWLPMLLGLVSLVDCSAADRGGESLTFERDVRPILKAMCFHCHGEQAEKEGSLDMRLVRLMQAGGESGAALKAGHAEGSLLWRRIAADEMPPGPKKLTPEQKSSIRVWIEQGATTARPEPANVEDARFTLEETSHWAFQPVRRPPLPQPDGYELLTPVDHFIADRLQREQLPFSPSVDRRQFLRRVSLDLTGLPPTVEEVRAFLEDSSPDAETRLVDRLLTSPQFGVRWGRHWLDVAGYSESDGGPERDIERPFAWRYRDYVVDAFNQDKPVDEFFREQLAGDEMVTAPIDPYNARQRELLAATGFLRMAPDPTQASNSLADRNLAVAESIKVVGSAVLGLTVGCAQCHDHKYDPIAIQDYYAFRAIFDPAFPLQQWQTPAERLVDMTTAELRAEIDAIEARARALEDDLNQRRNAACQQIQDRKLADVPESDREAVKAAVLSADSDLTIEQRGLLDRYPMVRPVGTILGLLVEYDMATYRAFEKEQNAIADIRATKPALTMVMVTRERPEVVPESRVFFRGDPESPGQPVAPAELAVLRHVAQRPEVAPDDTGLPTTGRRLTYARQLTDGQHPLTARVFVNRLWYHHMGRGLVASAGDLGLNGEAPTHPELLDWLADDFVRHGWDAKRLHRLIVLSRTYRQSSRRSPELDARDPENRWWARMNVRRLEAEVLRDSLFRVADRLDLRLGGESLPVTQDAEGKAVLGRPKVRDGLLAGVEPGGAEGVRRSLYVQVRRSLPLDVLATFDQPVMSPNCHARPQATVATQALWFLNDPESVRAADELAAQLLRDTPDDETARLRVLYERLFAEPPSEEELRRCAEYLTQQSAEVRNDADPDWRKTLEADPAAATRRALATLCQILMASNRFLYTP